MAEITDVYLKILYKKENEIVDKDILDDEDLFGVIFNLEYNGIDYVDEEKRILTSYGRWNYLNTFIDNETLLKELYEISNQKRIEMIYYIYCDSSEAMERVNFGVVKLNIKENKEPEHALVEENKFEEYVINKNANLKEKYENLLENQDDEAAEIYLQELEEVSHVYLNEKFKEFILNVEEKIDTLNYEVLEIDKVKKKNSIFSKICGVIKKIIYLTI